MTGPYARYGTIVLGMLLVIYAIVGLSKFSFAVAPAHEKWVGGIVGVVTGVVSAATGVQVIPSMPFMQAIGMEKDELVQALGVFFTIATVALAFNLTSAGLLDASTALPGAVAMAGSFAGMSIGQAVRSRHGAGDVPPLVPDRDDPARRLSRGRAPLRRCFRRPETALARLEQCDPQTPAHDGLTRYARFRGAMTTVLFQCRVYADPSLEQRRARHEGVERRPELGAVTVLLLQDFVLGAGDDQMRAGAQMIGELLDRGGRDDGVVAGGDASGSAGGSATDNSTARKPCIALKGGIGPRHRRRRDSQRRVFLEDRGVAGEAHGIAGEGIVDERRRR